MSLDLILRADSLVVVAFHCIEVSFHLVVGACGQVGIPLDLILIALDLVCCSLNAILVAFCLVTAAVDLVGVAFESD